MKGSRPAPCFHETQQQRRVASAPSCGSANALPPRVAGRRPRQRSYAQTSCENNRLQGRAAPKGAWDFFLHGVGSFAVMVALPTLLSYSALLGGEPHGASPSANTEAWNAAGPLRRHHITGSLGEPTTPFGKPAAQRRRLQTATTSSSFIYTTQTVMTLCVANTTGLLEAAVRSGVLGAFGIVNSSRAEPPLGSVDLNSTAEGCIAAVAPAAFVGQQWDIAIYNDNTTVAGATAAQAAASQVDSAEKGGKSWLDAVAAGITDAGSVRVTGAQLSLKGLGFVVAFSDTQPVAVASSQSLGTGFIGSQFMPWWSWLLYSILLCCCIGPLCYYMHLYRKEGRAPVAAGPEGPGVLLQGSMYDKYKRRVEMEEQGAWGVEDDDEADEFSSDPYYGGGSAASGSGGSNRSDAQRYLTAVTAAAAAAAQLSSEQDEPSTPEHSSDAAKMGESDAPGTVCTTRASPFDAPGSAEGPGSNPVGAADDATADVHNGDAAAAASAAGFESTDDEESRRAQRLWALQLAERGRAERQEALRQVPLSPELHRALGARRAASAVPEAGEAGLSSTAADTAAAFSSTTANAAAAASGAAATAAGSAGGGLSAAAGAAIGAAAVGAAALVGAATWHAAGRRGPAVDNAAAAPVSDYSSDGSEDLDDLLDELERRPLPAGARPVYLPMTELLARADGEEMAAREEAEYNTMRGRTLRGSATAPGSGSATPALAVTAPGEGVEDDVPSLLVASRGLTLSELLSNAEAEGMSLRELEEGLGTPLVLSPPPMARSSGRLSSGDSNASIGRDAGNLSDGSAASQQQPQGGSAVDPAAAAAASAAAASVAGILDVAGRGGGGGDGGVNVTLASALSQADRLSMEFEYSSNGGGGGRSHTGSEAPSPAHLSPMRMRMEPIIPRPVLEEDEEDDGLDPPSTDGNE